MRDHAVPASLVWLAALVALSIAVAAIAGGVIYLQTQQTARTQADAVTGGDWRRGRSAIARYNCGSCHVVPGVAGANGKVGPDLAHVGQRAELAGILPNDPMSMVRWLQHPQHVAPSSGMPEQNVSQADARDIAAFLYAQK